MMKHTLSLELANELYQRLKVHAEKHKQRIEEAAIETLQIGLEMAQSDWGADPLAHAEIWAPPVRKAPKDLAEEHDYYAYGGKKRSRQK